MPGLTFPLAFGGGGGVMNVTNRGTFAEMIATTPAAGTFPLWFVTTIDLGGDAGVRAVGALYAWNGSAWRPTHPVTLLQTIADTAGVTNSQTAFQANYAILPPVGLFYAGCHLDGAARSKTTLNGTPTASPQIFANGALLVASNLNVDQFVNVRPRMWCRIDNILSANGAAAGMDVQLSSTASVTMGAAFNGTNVTMQWGHTFSATGSDTTVVFEDISLVLYP